MPSDIIEIPYTLSSSPPFLCAPSVSSVVKSPCSPCLCKLGELSWNTINYFLAIASGVIATITR